MVDSRHRHASPDPPRTARRACNRVHRLNRILISLAAVLLAAGLHLNGQDEPSVQPDSEYTADQILAMDRVDKLSELLLGMPRTSAVVNALSQLGDVACRHDEDLGVRVFEKAYAISAGMALDLDEDSSLFLLSRLVSRASNCHPGFSSRSPTGGEDSPRLRAQARLTATLDAVWTNPAAAVGFAHDVVETLSDLDTRGHTSFAMALNRLRRERPAEADALFQRALREVTSSGSVAGLFALGNYVFGPENPLRPGAVRHLDAAGEGTVYGFSTTRPGITDELANLYIASSNAALARRGALGQEDLLAFGLTKQLESWAQSHAPHQVSALASLLGDQQARLNQAQSLSVQAERIRRKVSGLPLPGLEERIESAPDEPTKARLRFYSAYYKIMNGHLEEARKVVAELDDEIRPPLLDIIALKEVHKTIGEGDLEAARIGLSTLNDSLHLVLAALNLASAHRNLSDESDNRLAKDAQAAADAIRLAGSATAQVPDGIRPKVRVAIAGALALTGRIEESLAALELAVQESNTAKEAEKNPDEPLSAMVSDSGAVYATVTRDNLPRFSFNLMPPQEGVPNFAGAVLELSKSAEPELERLEGIVTRAVNPRMRTSGLVALAEGALANAFHPTSEPLTEPGNSDEPDKQTPVSATTDDEEAPD